MNIASRPRHADGKFVAFDWKDDWERVTDRDADRLQRILTSLGLSAGFVEVATESALEGASPERKAALAAKLNEIERRYTKRASNRGDRPTMRYVNALKNATSSARQDFEQEQLLPKIAGTGERMRLITADADPKSEESRLCQ
jgi:hypothetical protein